MRYLLALDSYKNCLDSRSASECVARGIHTVLPGAVTDILQVADGGEGSVRAVAANNPDAELCVLENISGPLGNRHDAEYAWLPKKKTAFLELAGVCGIELLPDNRLDVMHASTYGLGEMILRLHQQGIRKFTVAIGGSASCDGGLGLLQALGAQFFNRENKIIPAPAGPAAFPEIHSCNLKPVLNIAHDLSLSIFSDVTNPLLGPNGAAAVFGPQKGAAPDDIPVLEEGLNSLVRTLKQILPDLCCNRPGDGAAGGTGFALRAILNGTAGSGAEAILRMARIQDRIRMADWVITGEGQSDAQTAQGKLPAVIAAQAKKLRKPVILLSGAVRESQTLLNSFDAVFSIAQGPGSLQEAIRNTRLHLEIYGQNLAALTAHQKP